MIELLTRNIQAKDDFMKDPKVQLVRPLNIHETPDPKVLFLYEKVTLAEYQSQETPGE